MPDTKTILLAIVAAILFGMMSGCVTAEYNKSVSARETSISGFSKDGNYGATISRRVEYR